MRVPKPNLFHLGMEELEPVFFEPARVVQSSFWRCYRGPSKPVGDSWLFRGTAVCPRGRIPKGASANACSGEVGHEKHSPGSCVGVGHGRNHRHGGVWICRRSRSDWEACSLERRWTRTVPFCECGCGDNRASTGFQPTQHDRPEFGLPTHSEGVGYQRYRCAWSDGNRAEL